MAGLKRDAADNWFSKCIRERTDYECEMCGKRYDRSSTGLHCSHYHGRSNRGVRWDKDNCFALCYGCHQFVGANPHEHHKFAERKLGMARYQILLERKTSTELGKMMNKDNKQGLIAKHYREQHKILREARDRGETGYIDFLSYW